MNRFIILTTFGLILLTSNLFATHPVSHTSGAPAALQIQVDSVRHITCQYSTGYIALSASGGESPYAYQWADGANGAVRSNLSAGAYKVTLSDALGAEAILQIDIQTNTTLPAANAGPNVSVACSNAILTLNGTGATGPQYSYLWSAANGGSIQSGATTLTPVINHSGTFTLAVTNSQNGCTAFDMTVVSATAEPPTVSATGGTLNCIQQSVSLSAALGNANTIVNGWMGPFGYNSTLISPSVTVPGTYTVKVTDTLSTCSAQATATVSLNTQMPVVTATAGGTLTCAQTSVLLNGESTPAGLLYAWSGPNNFFSTLQDPTVTLAGPYTLVATNPINGCTGSATVNVASNTAAPSVTASVSGNLTCTTQFVGLSSTASPAGVSYLWSGPGGFSSGIANPTASTAGVYTVRVTHPQSGCTATASVTVTANTTAPGATATGGTITCAAASVTLNANSGTSGVTYQWKGPGNFNSTLKSPLASVPGTYTVTITSTANGCTSTANANVAVNTTAPTLTITGATISCNTPAPKVIASSNASGATYIWSGPNNFSSTASNPTVSSSGLYAVTVTNPANGCTKTNSVYVYEDLAAPSVYAGDDRSLNCYFTSLVMTPLVTPASNNYTYLWTTFEGNIVNGATTANARVDAPGFYTLTVKNNQNGCTTRDSLEVIQRQPVAANAIVTNTISCNGGSNGAVSASASGGNEIYSYTWSTGAQSMGLTNLNAATYTVTVYDGEGCSATGSVALSQPSLLQANVSTQPQTIQGVNNGSATASAAGGTFPYTYKWNNNATSITISNLAPGTYTVTITDQKGCTASKTANVNALACAMTGNTTSTQVTCNGAANGSATLNLSGAANPISYLWSNNANTKTISNLGPGTYTVTATDGNGCTGVYTAAISSPTALNVSVSGTNHVVCAGAATGSISLAVSGGVTPYNYTWTNGASGSNPANLIAGTYTVTVTDANSCTKKQTTQINTTDNNPPVLNLKNITVDLNANGQATLTPAMFDNGSLDLECNIASWTISPTSFDCTQTGVQTVALTATDQNGNLATGTAQVTIRDVSAPLLVCPENITVPACSAALNFNLPLIFDNCNTSGQATQTGGPAPGSVFPTGNTQVSYTFTDAAGNIGNCTFQVTVKPALEFSINAVAAACDAVCNGLLSVSVTNGVAPYSYAWSNGLNSNQISGLCTGNYTVTITDGSGCTSVQTRTIGVNTGTALNATAVANAAGCSSTCDGSAYLNISGGNQPLNVQWSNGLNGNAVNGLCAGNYLVTVTDASGCTLLQQVQVPVSDTQAPTLVCPGNLSAGYCNPTLSFQLPQVLDNCSVDYAQLQLISGLPAGSTFPVGATVQTFRYTDTGGNVGQCSFSITIHAQADISVSGTDVSCFGACNGSALLNINGGQAPFSIWWNTGATTEQVQNLCPGTYGATVIDGDGCLQSRQLTITQPQGITLLVHQVNADNGGAGTGNIDISVLGGTAPYTFAWMKNGQFFANTEDLNQLLAGQYVVSITDANGCNITSGALTVSTIVGTDEAASENHFQLYPNPVTGNQLYLKTEQGNTDETLQISVFDLSGRLLKQFPEIQGGAQVIELDLAGLPDGILLFRIAGDHGMSLKRIVKSNN
jgi:large repetitive protein